MALVVVNFTHIYEWVVLANFINFDFKIGKNSLIEYFTPVFTDDNHVIIAVIYAMA